MDHETYLKFEDFEIAFEQLNEKLDLILDKLEIERDEDSEPTDSKTVEELTEDFEEDEVIVDDQPKV